MKKLYFLRLLIGAFVFLLFARQASAQLVGFNFYLSDSIGSKISFTDAFTWEFVDQTTEVNFGSSPGVTISPSSVMIYPGKGGQVDVTITVQTDSLAYVGAARTGCLGNTLLSGPAMVWSNYEWFVIIGGYIYDPKTIGRISIDSNTLNLGNVAIGGEDSIFENVLSDTLSNISADLQPLNVRLPFASPDSIISEYNCSGFASSYSSYGWYFRFSPTAVGHYIDTTYLYDPIRKDSTMLILIGDGVAPDVVNSPPQEVAMQVYPNPCDQFANIVLPPEALEQVEIRNALGAVVQSYRNVNSDFTLDASSLPDGIYFIEARTDGAVVTKKLVVIH